MERLEDRRVLAQMVWDGGGDGTSWTDALNWDLNQTPGAIDDVTINQTDGTPVRVTSNTTVQSLTLTSASNVTQLVLENVDFAAGTINVGVNATLTVEGSSTIAGDIDNNGLFEAVHHIADGPSQQVTVALTGAFLNNDAGMLRLLPSSSSPSVLGSEASLTVDFQNGLTNDGVIEISEGPSDADDMGNSVLKVSNGMLTNNSTIYSFHGNGSGDIGTRTISGSVENPGYLQVERSLTMSDGPVTNSGTFEVLSERLEITQELTNFSNHVLSFGNYYLTGELAFPNDGIVTNQAYVDLYGPGAAVVDLGGQDAFATLESNEGEISLYDGKSLALADPFVNRGYVYIGDGSTLSTTGDYRQIDDDFLYYGDTEMAPGGVLDPAGAVRIEAGDFYGSGTIAGDLINNGYMYLYGGPLTVEGDLITTGTLSLTFNASVYGEEDTPIRVTGSADLGGMIEMDSYERPQLGAKLEGITYASLANFDAEFNFDYGFARYFTSEVTDAAVYFVSKMPLVRIDPVDGLITTEEGGTAKFKVQLEDVPAAPVMIGFATSDDTEGAVSSSMLTFTSADWNVPQYITVTGLNDPDDDGDISYTIISSSTSSADPDFNGHTVADVTLTNRDDEGVDFVLGAPSSGFTTEAGGQSEFTVVLNSQPTSDVTLFVRSNNTREGTVSVESIVFTPANWNVPQTVTITGQNDPVDDGDTEYSISIGLLASEDPLFQLVTPRSVYLSNQDDDTADFVWDGGGDGFTWSDPLNWTGDQVPGVGANVLIPNMPGNGFVEVIFDTVNIGSVYSDERLILTYSNFAVSEGAVAAYGLDFEGGTLVGDWTTYGDSYWNDGTLIFNATWNNLGSLDFAGFSASYLVGTLNNSGTITIGPSANIYTQGSGSSDQAGTLNNLADGVVEAFGGSILPYWGNGNFGAINNEGLWRKTTDATLTIRAPFNMKGGTIDAQAGTLTLSAGVDNTGGSYLSSPGATLTYAQYRRDGVFTGVYDGSGTVQFTSGKILGADVELRLTGKAEVNGGSLVGSWTNYEVLEFSSGNQDSGVTWTNLGTFIIPEAASVILVGTLDNSGTITIGPSANIYTQRLGNSDQAGTLNNLVDGVVEAFGGSILPYYGNGNFGAINNEGLWRKTTDATLTISTPISVASTGTLQVDAGLLNLKRTFSNFANQTLTDGSYIVSGELRFVGADIVTNAAVIELIGPDALIRSNSLTNALASVATNQSNAALRIREGANLTTPGPFANAGEVYVGGGSTLFVQGDYNQTTGTTSTGLNGSSGTVDPSGDFLVGSGMLSGAGFVNANVINTAGIISPGTNGPAGLYIFGELTQGADASIAIDLAGSQPFSQYDVLVVGGAVARLDGTLAVDIADTFLPLRDDFFDVLAYNSLAGDFFAITGLEIDANRALVPSRTEMLYTLTSVIAGIRVEPAFGLQTTEGGGTAAFTVVLEDQPSAPVTIALASDNLNEGTIDKSELIFTPANWDQPQTVTITGEEDLVQDGNVAYSIVTSAAVSTDPLFNGLNPSDVLVVNLDNDLAGITLGTPTSTQTTEAGGASEFTIVLDAKPSANVELQIVSDQPDEGLPAPGKVTFTVDNWNVAQTVVITGQNDDIDDGDASYSVIVSVKSTTDPSYAALTAKSFNLTNLDDDTAGINIVAPAQLITSESGGQATFTISLASEPVAPVEIVFASNKPLEATLDYSSYTFFPSTWNQPLTVTATGLDDLLDDGDVPFQVTFDASISTDPLYNGVILPAIDGINQGTDTFELEVTSLSVPSPAVLLDPPRITIDWSVRNLAPIDIPSSVGWSDDIYFSLDDVYGNFDDQFLATIPHNTGLLAGQSYSKQQAVTLPDGLAGTVYFYVRTDWANSVPEIENYTNNVSTLQPSELINDRPDLNVELVSSDASGQSGGDVSFTWRVANIGQSPAKASWQDSVYLSLDQTLDGSDIFVGNVLRSSDLANGANYTTTDSLTTTDRTFRRLLCAGPDR